MSRDYTLQDLSLGKSAPRDISAARDTVTRYAAAILVTGGALLLQLGLWPYMEALPFVVFFGAVMFSGWQGGWGPGLLSTGMSLVLADYFFLGKPYEFSGQPRELIALAMFMVVCCLLTLLNATVRTSHQRAREHEEWLSTTLKSIGDGVIATDAQGRIVFLNPVAEELTQWRQAQARGRTLTEVFRIIHETSREELESPVAKVIRARRVVGLANSTLLLRRDGSEVAIDDSGAPILDAHGSLRGVVLVFRDVTAKKRREAERMRLLEETRAAVHVRDEFLSVAAHELKTPLTPLQLRLDSLKETAQKTSDGALPAARVIRDTEIAQRQVRKLGALVGSLLDVSRLSTGRLQLHRTNVDLSDLTREIVAQLQLQAQASGCEVQLEAPAPVRGTWDRLRLEQVVTNLLSNAFKYGAGKPVHIQVWAEDGHARLRIRDEGIGIEPGQEERIFGMFERAVSDRHYGGLGLGLYISQQIIHALGGTIRVENQPSRGATFSVELPLTR